jgi:cation-transporting ATPase I
MPSRLGRAHRRTWVHAGKAHIEVRSATRPGSERLAARLKERLGALEGVDWAEVNGVVGRVIVAFDGDTVAIADLIDVIDQVERAELVDHERFSHHRIAHPGDQASLRGPVLALAADLAGVGLSMATTVLRASPIPVEAATLVSFIDNQPRLRRWLEDQAGPWFTDLGLAVGNAVGQALGQGPVGLAVDAGHRLNLLLAAHARQLLWVEREAGLTASPRDAARDPVDVPDRPIPIPPGPIETYLNRAGLAGLVGGGATFALLGSARRAAATMLASVGKAARLGRETYGAHLELLLARRGVLVFEPRAVRRLDRIDCLLLPAAVLHTGRQRPEQVVLLPGNDAPEIHARIRALFDPTDPTAMQRRGRWSLGPLSRFGAVATAAAAELIDPHPVADPLAVCRDGEVVALFETVPDIDPYTHLLVDAAHDAGLTVVVADDDPRTITRVHADVQVGNGSTLQQAVIELHGWWLSSRPTTPPRCARPMSASGCTWIRSRGAQTWCAGRSERSSS